MVAEVKGFSRNLASERIYTPSEIGEMLSNIMEACRTVPGRQGTRDQKAKYYNISAAFDIETSSITRVDGTKAAWMYIWQLGLNGLVMIGRTWEELDTVIDRIVEELGLGDKVRLPIYVHSLQYEFQFFRKRIEWDNVFSIKERHPIRALAKNGIEFRCSAKLSGHPLRTLHTELVKYTGHEKTNDLDYSKIRHSGTPLTKEELKYCVEDVKVVMAYIEEKIEREGGVGNILMTKTGYVRALVRDRCFFDGEGAKRKSRKRQAYLKRMRALTLSLDDYKQCKRAFQGGFTHASWLKANKALKGVTSMDIASAYPTVLVSEKFPMSAPIAVNTSGMTVSEIMGIMKSYCCLFDLRLTGVTPKLNHEHPISVSRCTSVKGAVVDNGRIVYADTLTTTCTEQDFAIYKDFYNFESVTFMNFKKFVKGYLPKEIVESVLYLYKNKTSLKGDEAKKVLYNLSKAMLNSCYGMMVTDILRVLIQYIDGWEGEMDEEVLELLKKSEPTPEEMLAEHNNSASRFLYYPWGVWVTAYNRRNIFTAIKHLGEDYVYSDTDCVKYLNKEKHEEFFKSYNRMITAKMDNALREQGIDPDAARPESAKKVEGGQEIRIRKQLGVFEDEGTATHFKTLGAKRYIQKVNGKWKLTVAGTNKLETMAWIEEAAKAKGGADVDNDILELFSFEMEVPANRTGKSTHTYIDEEISGEVTDYTGVKGVYHEYTALHMEPASFKIHASAEYIKYLSGAQEMEKSVA